MSIYVGDKKFDLHYTTTGNKVNRSVFKGENKIWPLYEFSFYDGSMQKNIENVPASGQDKSIEIRTCEDSWWHKLKFDEIYVFDKAAANSWLRYNAINLNCQEKPIKTHWLSVIKGDNYSINPENSDDRQTISFSDNYNNISNLNNSGGTCNENLHDINMNYKIDKNDWFVSRSGYMYGKQYDEWDHISGTTKNYYHFYDLSPSDNTPIIYIYQVANSWYNSDENKEFEQKIEFTCTPIVTSVVGGEVQLTWKIYSLSSSGTTIYYGSNIASNNSTEETSGEVYAKGYMWITASNPNITLNTDSVKKSISSDGVVTWTMTATWGSNEALGKNASHTIAFNGFPKSIPFNIDSTYNISATCTQISKDRENIFTLNISSKNNWRPGSATCKCSQSGETRQLPCYVNDTNSFSDKKTSITITVNKVKPGNKVYYLSVDKSSITTENNNFIVKSYYIQDSNPGVTITVYAQCEDGDIITSRSITQEPNLGGSGGVGFNVTCNGEETIDPNSVSAEDLTSNFTKEITVVAHPILGDTINNVITVTQNESGKIITLVHIADPAVEHKYEYRILLFDNESNVQDITNKNGISNITLSSSTTQTTIYARLEEKCTSVTDTGVCEIGDPMNIYKSYNYIPIKSTAVSHSGVKLSDFTNFTFNGEEWSKGDPVYNDSYITITLSGSANNDSSSSTKYCSMNMLSDTTSTIPPSVCDKDTDAFWFKFSLNEITSTGGYTRTGTFSANYNDVAKAICNLSQTSSVTSSSTSASITGKKDDISLSFDPSGAFDKSRIEESNGEYTVYIKTLTDFYANSDPAFVEGLDNGYELNAVSNEDVTITDTTESVKFKVVVKGNKYYTQYEDENKNKINSRSVTVTASYKYNEKETSVTTSTKTQNVCNKVDSTQKYEVSNIPGITWTADEQNTSLYTDYNPKSGVETTVSINSKISGSTSKEKTITFTATINNTDKSKDFTITWPKTANISTSWTYTINIDISLTNKCQSSNFYIKINDKKIDGTDVTVNSGSSNKIEYTSEKINETEVKPTIKLYKNHSDGDDELVEDYGENPFTITANTLSKYYSENCEDTTQYYIEIIGGPDFTTCPGTTVEIKFKITDDTNYYNFNGNGTAVINNDKFTINEYISYKDSINTIKVTTSGTNGDTGKLTISVNVNGSDNTVTKNINITNNITYTCGGIEEV